MTPQTIRTAILLCIGLVAATIAGFHATATTNRSLSVAAQAATHGSGDQVSLAEGFAPVVQRTIAAVVNIASSKVVRTPQDPILSDPFFRQFFGDEFLRQWGVPSERRERSLGSGVIVGQDGHILTNNHVVEGATEIKVLLWDKRELKARILGTDPQTRNSRLSCVKQSDNLSFS